MEYVLTKGLETWSRHSDWMVLVHSLDMCDVTENFRVLEGRLACAGVWRMAH